MSGPIRIGQRSVGPLQVFSYLVQCTATGEAVIIDPGGAEEQLARWAADEGADVRLVLNTHGHGDHVAGNERLCALLDVDCALLGQEVDFFGLERSLENRAKLVHVGTHSVRSGLDALRGVLHIPESAV